MSGWLGGWVVGWVGGRADNLSKLPSELFFSSNLIFFRV